MDVERSFHKIEKLSFLLKLYAYSNYKVGYVQGINFILGYLLTLYQDKYLALSIFHVIITEYLGINQDLACVKKKLYVLSRLISIYLPDLQQHFSVLGINT